MVCNASCILYQHPKKYLDMRNGGPVFSCSFMYTLRIHACKALVLALVIFIFLEYATNMLVYREPINKIVAPGLAWISSSLNRKLSNEQRVPPEWNVIPANKDPCVNCNTLNVNSTVSKLTNASTTNIGNTTKNSTSHTIEECPLVPPKLVGRLKVLTDAPSFEKLETMYSNLSPGGRFKPPDCIARNKVALIIPYRDREEHLRMFLHNMHPILQRQQLDYGIYVIEEAADIKFNRAMLMNIGYVEALKQYDYDCFIFHDVDLIPEDDRNLYTCPRQPRHMSVAINTMNYRLPYKDIFGGVSALTKKHMETVNGFSNEFWGWGGEDDDMSNRIRHHGLQISRYSPKIARYTMLKHKKDDPNPDRYNKLYKGKYRFKKDGLSNLKYKRLDIVLKKLYTWVVVEIEPIKK